jgi:hypothetical protein
LAEFLAAILGLVDVLVPREPPYVVKFRGDSCSAQDQECVMVFGKLKGDADSFLLKSIKNSTKIYDSAWKRWCSFIQERYSDLTDPTVENLTSSQKLNLMIKFMSTVYDLGLRGDQITVLMRGEAVIILTSGGRSASN